jgi:hypothetical protein
MAVPRSALAGSDATTSTARWTEGVDTSSLDIRTRLLVEHAPDDRKITSFTHRCRGWETYAPGRLKPFTRPT